MGQSKFRFCNSIFLQNPSLRKQKSQKFAELNARTESGNHKIKRLRDGVSVRAIAAELNINKTTVLKTQPNFL
jgi:DNA-binding NarL/FixJ family response regulator